MEAEKNDYINSGLIAGVAVEKALYSFDILFEYSVSREISEAIAVGKRVIIPFGNGSKRCVGMVMTLREGEYEPRKTKKILTLVDEDIILDEEQVGLVKWLKENTFCTYFDAVKLMIPTGLGISIREQYGFKKPSNLMDFSDEELKTIELISSCGSTREADDAIKELHLKKRSIYLSLLEKGVISELHEAKQKIGDETVKLLKLSMPEEELALLKLTPKQKQVINLLDECASASVKEICYSCNITAAVVHNLVKKGIIEEYEYEISRSITKDNEAKAELSDLNFSPSQQKVFDGLCDLLRADEARCALLHGVTGSGKTSVFIKLIEQTLITGRTALMLVPEIALTPQMTENFIRMFGNKVAIIHSSLSIGQRADEYKRIKNGEARIVIGTRSAVFAPVQNIGIIVIDEEGEHTYKSERSPRYHARNVAKQRAFYNKSLLLLASATPSLDSYYSATVGKYSLFELNERYSKAVLPDVYIVDMKIEAEGGNRTNFSEVLINEIADNLKKGEQSLILLNRRGYHTYANCIACGAVVDCPNCGIALTYHKANETVQCHYCGFSREMPNKCDKCGSKFIHQSGTGTQRIEDELQGYFPNARILRMDADTTMTKNAYEKKFTAFGRGEYDIMVGTQMIAKGLDFENVTLVGVLLIDKSLYAGDYIGYERTFSLITQVVGRSGRGTKKGRAYLQTFTPDHYVMQLAATQNYREFYSQEIDVRKALIFPPFCDLFLISFSSVIEKKAENAARRFNEIFKENIEKQDSKLPFILLGPTKSTVGRINGRFRYKVIIKAKNNSKFRAVIAAVQLVACTDALFKDVSFYVDINGDIP